MSKICNKCNIEKCFDLYHKDKSKKDGYRNSFNEGKIREYGTNRYNELKYDDAFKERTKEIRKKYNIKNRIKVKLRCKKYNQDNKDNIREQKRVYIKNNREVLLNYRNKNIDRIRKTSNEWTKRRLNSDPLFKLSTNIRNHYTNFQPLDSYENRVIKRDKLVYG